jgi:Lambda phage tail tube protein, TTP
MAQGGILGNGTIVAYSQLSPISWVEIEQRREVVFPTEESDKVEITTHSVTNKRKRYMAGLIEVGDPSVLVLTDMNPVTSPDQAALRAANKTGESLMFRIEVPTNRQRTEFLGVEFQASVKNFSPDTPIDGAQTTRFTFTFDGESITEDSAVGPSEIL